MNCHVVTRRRLLKGAAAAAAPWIVPASALGRAARPAPSDRTTVGCIGVGLKGSGGAASFLGLENVQLVAVCDVDSHARDGARAYVDDYYGRQAGRVQWRGCAAYSDFRELLNRDDIDAVLVATPDHWHVPIAIAAIRSGKDVYGEKPMGVTIREGRALVDAVRRYGRIFQHGTQLRSTANVRRACEMVRNGVLGRVHTVRIGSPAGLTMGDAAPAPVPEGFDYELWQGPAPAYPYTPDRVKVAGKLPGWYFVRDYSPSGWIAGYAVHDIDIAQWALGHERTGPLAVEGEGDYPAGGLFDTVTRYRLEYTYPGGTRVIVASLDRHPDHGVTFIGEHGSIYVRDKLRSQPEALLDRPLGPDAVRLYASSHHEADFIDCVRTRREPIAPVEAGHTATSACLMGDIAMRLGRRLEWDAGAERFRGDPEADRRLSRAMRAPWSL